MAKSTGAVVGQEEAATICFHITRKENKIKDKIKKGMKKKEERKEGRKEGRNKAIKEKEERKIRLCWVYCHFLHNNSIGSIQLGKCLPSSRQKW